MRITVPSEQTDYVDAALGLNFSADDFEMSVDFRKSVGTHEAMAWLNMGDNITGNLFGIYNWTNYLGWTNINGGENPVVAPPFGDEDTVFHTLKIAYDASNDIVSAYVDETFLYSKSVIFSNDLILWVGSKSGIGMECQLLSLIIFNLFQNLQL